MTAQIHPFHKRIPIYPQKSSSSHRYHSAPHKKDKYALAEQACHKPDCPVTEREKVGSHAKSRPPKLHQSTSVAKFNFGLIEPECRPRYMRISWCGSILPGCGAATGQGRCQLRLDSELVHRAQPSSVLDTWHRRHSCSQISTWSSLAWGWARSAWRINATLSPSWRCCFPGTSSDPK